ncbi:sigma-70 family RNA polymerase sigma factor [Neisseria wadsworthii]|uniref:RpoE family DNA-directed RNA polymerase sigma subunit n=1 Tax=Neisseria wadsworthii 9715 TaxID=1030841 RepID=G4CNZ0_9NEIS|nr:sigma-70 family RNA polymerase sigma factor [Neisseria wadsworthii]EGZ48940.1 RpoE family DNA-directed RNA polymerase sigma subunit [Neisseria wadsworthii 9715]QMT34643.1 sigma-70 family RNA polymerase sigma factor [Neisseria wadsworthii]
MPTFTDFSNRIAALRPAMLKFARMQLRDESLSEDLVQDALSAAINKQEQYRAGAELGTWVMSILKNKIIDYYRGRKDMISLDDSDQAARIDAQYQACFDEGGHWQKESSPEVWQPNPTEAHLEQQDFFKILEKCLGNLPENTARIFYLKEVMGMEVEEICHDFGITPNNCYAILHRARNGLRQCLQKNWYGTDKGET